MMLQKSDKLIIHKRGESYFIYNSILGNLVEVDKKIIEILNSFKVPRITSLSDPNITDLFNKKFLIEESRDEYVLLKEGIEDFKRFFKVGGLLRKLQLVVSTRCNLACTYCYEDRTGVEKNKHVDMSFKVAKKAIDGFFEVINRNNQKKVYIRYFGGEPLMNWKLIEKCSEYMKQIKTEAEIIQLINTNGTTITNHIAQYLSENNFDVSISLDAPDEVNDKYRKFKQRNRGTFKRIDAVLSVLQKYDVDVEISAQLHDININRLIDFVDYIKLKGLQRFEINTLICDDLGLCNAPVEERVRKLMELKKYAESQNVHLHGKWLRLYNLTKDGALNYCSRYGEQFSVNPSGEITPCSGLSLRFGSIDDIESVFRNNNYEKLCMHIIGQITECRGCEIEGMCVGGCIPSAELFKTSKNEDYPKESLKCDFRKAIVAAQIGTALEREDPTYFSLTKGFFKGV